MNREAIVTVAFAVVAFSIIVQDMPIKPVMRRCGEKLAK
jgi:NhaP-type Na+/H+ or K+/H+ antiporter